MYVGLLARSSHAVPRSAGDLLCRLAQPGARCQIEAVHGCLEVCRSNRPDRRAGVVEDRGGDAADAGGRLPRSLAQPRRRMSCRPAWMRSIALSSRGALPKRASRSRSSRNANCARPTAVLAAGSRAPTAGDELHRGVRRVDLVEIDNVAPREHREVASLVERAHKFVHLGPGRVSQGHLTQEAGAGLERAHADHQPAAVSARPAGTLARRGSAAGSTRCCWEGRASS